MLNDITEQSIENIYQKILHDYWVIYIFIIFFNLDKHVST